MAPYLGYCREPCRRFLMWVQRKRMVRPARKDLTNVLDFCHPTQIPLILTFPVSSRLARIVEIKTKESRKLPY